MRQYDELVKKDPNFGVEGKKKKKSGKAVYTNLADELLDNLDQHEKDMNDMLKYLSEVEELIRNP